jgi:glutamate-1-semialdehyde 2,1-aminomutase
VDSETPNRSLEKNTATTKVAAQLFPMPQRQEGEAPGAGASAPLFIARASGARLTDLDGNEYIDYACASGALLLGHADERVVAAVTKAATKGESFGLPTHAEVRLAELIAGRCSGAERIVFAESPRVAARRAVDLARAATERSGIVALGPSTLVREALRDTSRAGSNEPAPAATSIRGRRKSASSPAPHAESDDGCANLPPRAVDELARLLETRGERLAAVILDPITDEAGVSEPPAPLLANLKELCTRHGVLLIFDETRTGFRLGRAGAAGRFGVWPDLLLYGSVLGAGIPIGAIAGRKDVMNRLEPTRGAPWDGLFVGNVLAIAAGTATLQVSGEDGFYDALESVSASLEEGLKTAIAEASAPLHVSRVGSVVSLRDHAPPTTGATAPRRVKGQNPYGRFGAALRAAGVYAPLTPDVSWFVSAAHAAEQIEQTIECARGALRTRPPTPARS